ncbi:disease resistance protein RPM1-like [Prosopis cineraria]|uniref:disease resistance protein RPM1-like n=1 Tax=Prosopis cineraria TaxID=364024 RepID=UPI00240FF7A9|nr:disease resistance protein RPM1-like [Prosopis cineraria]
MKAYLKDADVQAERSSTNSMVKDWVRNVREIAHDIEDVIDKYRYRVARRKIEQRHHAGLAGRAVGFVTRIVSNHEISDEIQEIRERISRQDGIRKSLGLTGGEEGGGGGRTNGWSWQDQKQVAPILEEHQVVGFQEQKRTLMNLLNRGKNMTVIPVVGQGGLGKTTLVSQLYRLKEVENNFHRRAWVEVSQSYDSKHMLKTLIRELKSQKDFESDKAGIRHLNEQAQNCLKNNKCLIVFDDVWDTDFWDSIKSILPPQNKNGSRIIITTRRQAVADHCKGHAHTAEVKPLNMKPLEHQEAKKLFNRVVFDGDECPKDLQILSHEIIQKCEGIPLAITTIGSLLSKANPDDISKWQNVSKNLSRILATDTNPEVRVLNAIVSESYYNLPYHLKLCFLYLGIFPEDYHINCKRLIRLWIAEGFVQEGKTETLEQVGMNYLQELINRNLVQAAVTDFDGKVRSYRVHDMMRGFILKKFAEVNFCHVLDNIGSDLGFSDSPRRLSVQQNYSKDELLDVVSDLTVVRSCILFNTKGISISLLPKFKHMRTLDFDDAPLNVLPEDIGDLYLLEYLSLRNTRVKKLPRSIGKLENLLTLDLKNSQVQKLPKEINKLIKLRQLLGYSFHGGNTDSSMDFSVQGLQIKEGFGNFKFLQKLNAIDFPVEASIIKELKKLKQLKKLGITRLRSQNGKDLCSVIDALTNLTSLWIGAVDEEEFLELDSLANPLKNLQRLCLEGRLRKLPEWIPKLKKLVRLRLIGSGLTDDPVFALRNLNELLELRLRRAYQGEELCFKKGWLKKLKILRLRYLQQLKTLKIEDKALLQLETLYLGPCPQMAEAPDDFQNLKKLQSLRFCDMPDAFTYSIQEGHSKYNIIKDIPHMFFRSSELGFNGYINNSLHYANILKNRFGDENPAVRNNLAPKGEMPFSFDKNIKDQWFWVTALLVCALALMLAFVSKYVEQLSYRIF